MTDADNSLIGFRLLLVSVIRVCVFVPFIAGHGVEVGTLTQLVGITGGNAIALEFSHVAVKRGFAVKIAGADKHVAASERDGSRNLNAVTFSLLDGRTAESIGIADGGGADLKGTSTYST